MEKNSGQAGHGWLRPGWRWFYPYNAPEDRVLPELGKGNS